MFLQRYDVEPKSFEQLEVGFIWSAFKVAVNVRAVVGNPPPAVAPSSTSVYALTAAAVPCLI